MEAERSEVQGYLWLRNEFKVSLGYKKREKHSTGKVNVNERFYQLLYFVTFHIYQALLHGLREKHTVGPGLHSVGEAAVNLCTHTLAPNLPEDDTVVEMLWEIHVSVIVLQTSWILNSASLQ